MPEDTCIFCHIASGKMPSKKVYEDDAVIGILDINPASPGHVLVIPKKHVMIMPQMPEEDISHAFNVAKRLSLQMLRVLKAKGTNIFVANGAAAGQKAPHFMIHVIPREEQDKLKLWPKEGEITQDMLEQLRQSLLPQVKQLFGLTDEKMKALGATEKPEPLVPEKKGGDLDFDALQKVLNGM
jgi:histidine triad (HIT) family protein